MCDPWRFRNVTLSHDFPKKRAKIEQVVREWTLASSLYKGAGFWEGSGADTEVYAN